MRFRISRSLRREPAVLATALAGAAGPLVVGRVTNRDEVPVATAAAVGALLGLLVGSVARRRTWSADRVEDDLLDAEMALEETP